MKSSNQLIKLYIPCPNTCACGDNKPKYWVHDACGTQYQIDSNGDVNCQKGCGKQFIQDFGFNCKQGSSKLRNVSHVVMSIVSGVQLQGDLEDVNIVQFLQTFNLNVLKRWMK